MKPRFAPAQFIRSSLALCTLAATSVASADMLLFDPGTSPGQSNIGTNHFEYVFGTVPFSATISANGITITGSGASFVPYTSGAYAIGGDFAVTASVLGEATGTSLVGHSLAFTNYSLNLPAGSDLSVSRIILVFGSAATWGDTGGSLVVDLNPATGTSSVITAEQVAAASLTGTLTQIQFVYEGRNSGDDTLNFAADGLSISFDSLMAVRAGPPAVSVFDPGTLPGQSNVGENHFDYVFGDLPFSAVVGPNRITISASGASVPSYTRGTYAIGGDFGDTTSVIGEATGTSLIGHSFALTNHAFSLPAGTDLASVRIHLIFGLTRWAGDGGSIVLDLDEVTATTSVVSASQAAAVSGFLTQVQFDLQGRNSSDDTLNFTADGLSLAFDSLVAVQVALPDLVVPEVVLGRLGNFLTLTFDALGDATLVYSIEATNDLTGTWTTVQTYPAFTAPTSQTYLDTYELSPSQPRRFLRLRITRP